MSNVIYQPVAGRLRIDNRDFSLNDLVMDYVLSNDGITYLITIKSKILNTVIANVELSDIKDNSDNGYASISEWVSWWNSLENDIGTLKNKQFPNVGIHVLTGTSAAPTGTYTGFLVLEDVTISTITLIDSDKVTGDNDFSEVSIPSGMFIEIPGGFSTITLSAGSMILIKGE